SLGEIVRRHEVLRTRIVSREGRPVQVIEEPGEIELQFMDVSGLVEREEQARDYVMKDGLRAFDLERGGVWRSGLVRLDAEEHVLLVCLHHVASDGWSTGIMTGEFTALYEEYRKGRPSGLPELPVQYADFAYWQRQWLEGEVLERQLEYWRDQLRGATLLELPGGRARPAVGRRRGGEGGLILPAGLGGGVNA